MNKHIPPSRLYCCRLGFGLDERRVAIFPFYNLFFSEGVFSHQKPSAQVMDVENTDLKRPAEAGALSGEAPLKKAKLEGEELLHKVAAQIDFWFNDSNFRTDK